MYYVSTLAFHYFDDTHEGGNGPATRLIGRFGMCYWIIFGLVFFF
jgi:hypothetical protein